MDEYAIANQNASSSPQEAGSSNMLKILMETQRELKQIRNGLLANPQLGAIRSSSIGNKQQSSANEELSELQDKYNQMVICHEEQRKEYQISIAEKDEQIQILQKLLRSQYLKEVLLQASIKHLLKERISAVNGGGNAPQNIKNSIVLGIFNREQVDIRHKSRDNSNLRLQSMLRKPSPPRVLTQRSPNIGANRVDRIKESLSNLNGLKRHFGNDSKFRQDVLEF